MSLHKQRTQALSIKSKDCPKSYLDDDVQKVYRGGKWVSIRDHNDVVSRARGLNVIKIGR